MFGHSAGSQFVHRYLYYKPDARVERYLAANAGWYTLPVCNVAYRYGLRDAAINKKRLRAAFSKDVELLLGRDDVDREDPDLRQTKEADRQGPNRFARGLTMHAVAKKSAEALGVDLKWRVVIVEDAGHLNAEMAREAVRLVR